MSANTSFATTTSALTQFIAKQKITNSTVTSDLSSTEYPISINAPLSVLRSDILKSTTISINQATTLQSGYISNIDWNIFNGKLTSITPGTNISSTGGINPTVSLSISSQIDMSNNPLTRISSQDFNTNIDIKQAGNSRIYTTSGVNSDMTITPQGNLRILSDVSLNGKTLDMGGNGVINGISNENFPTNIDLRQNNVKRIYTRNVNGNMNIDSTGLYLNSDVSFNGNLEVNNKDILNVRNQSFNTDININQGTTSRIKTNGTTNMTLSAPGYLNITTDVSMNGKSIDMSGGSFKKVNYTDMSLNGNTIDMVGGAIIRVGNQNFQTNIDIKQAGVSRIYTSGGTDMTIDPLGNLRILSDVSLTGNRLDMGIGVITGISNENFPTNIDIRQNEIKRIYTSGVDMTIAPSGNLIILSDLSMNGNTINMGTGGIITAPAKLTLNPIKNVDVLSDVSLNGYKLDMNSGKIINVYGIYGVPTQNLRIDAKTISLTNDLVTHMNIDNTGIKLNEITNISTGNVLTFDTSTKLVSYYPLYESYTIVTYLYSGIGGSNNNFNLKINKVADTVTIHIPATSCTVGGVGPPPPFLDFSYVLDAKYRPTSEINFPAIVYTITTITPTPPPPPTVTTTYKTGKFKILTDGSMYLYNDIKESASVWVASLTPPDSGVNYIIGQCFTYTV